MTPEQYERYRENSIERGEAYQDFVVSMLIQHAKLAVVQFASRAYQLEVGESCTGVEIKFDDKFKRTGNLWIEFAEKARPRAGDYVPSGIAERPHDNAWLYVIGDYQTIFVFAKIVLQAVKVNYRTVENTTKTSLGFLLPRPDAVKLSSYIVTPEADVKVPKAIKDLNELGRLLHMAVRHDAQQATLFELGPRE